LLIRRELAMFSSGFVQVSLWPAHTDACIAGLKESGRWKLARSVGAPIVSHFIAGDLQQMSNARLLRLDNEYIHCAQLSDATWKLIADSGGHVSIAPAIEMQMRHGTPPFQAALDHGIRPSSSVDVEYNMTADMFTNMRTAFTSSARWSTSEPSVEKRTCRAC